MSLLDNGPDVVLLYPEVIADDGYGTPVRVPSDTPVQVRGHVQPVEALELELTGQEVRTTYRLIARDIPGGAWARVVWGGRDWDAAGEPKHFRSTPKTSHSTLLLVARTAAPL